MAGPGRAGGDDACRNRARAASGPAVQRGGSRCRRQVPPQHRGKDVAMMPASTWSFEPSPRLLEPMTAGEAALWLPARRSHDAPRVRLLCLPYAGGARPSITPGARDCLLTSRCVQCSFRRGRTGATRRRSRGWTPSSRAWLRRSRRCRRHRSRFSGTASEASSPTSSAAA